MSNPVDTEESKNLREWAINKNKPYKNLIPITIDGKSAQRSETGHNDTPVIGLTVKTPDGYGKVISVPYTDTLEVSVDGATGLYNICDLKSL